MMMSFLSNSISRLIRHQSLPCYWPPAPVQTLPASAQGEEAGPVAMAEERMEAIIEANDVLLERVVSALGLIIHGCLLLNSYFFWPSKGVLMDEACGLRKKREEETAVLSAPIHQGTAEVASWNQEKVGFSHFSPLSNV